MLQSGCPSSTTAAERHTSKYVEGDLLPGRNHLLERFRQQAQVPSQHQCRGAILRLLSTVYSAWTTTAAAAGVAVL